MQASKYQKGSRMEAVHGPEEVSKVVYLLSIYEHKTSRTVMFACLLADTLFLERKQMSCLTAIK